MKLNAENIRVALRCHADEKNKCAICPYNKENCSLELAKDTLALINSQEQRIKELTEKVVQLLSQVDCDKAEINLLRKHIESLGTTIEMQEQEVHSIKSDTVRKMHSMLCEGRVSNDPVVIATNVVAKEMLERG